MNDLEQYHEDAGVLYQVLGALLHETDLFDTDRGQAALDLAAYLAGCYDERPESIDSLLPWNPPQGETL